MLGFAASDDRLDASGPELAPVFVAVLAAVGDHFVGSLAWTAGLARDRGDPVYEHQELGDVVAVRSGELRQQRDAVRVDDQMVL